jgi:signal transduction histidine kinase
VTDSTVPANAVAAAADRRDSEALEALSEAVGAIAGVLDVETVLQVIVDRARTLVPARYAALGIVDDGGRIEQFITSGITAAQRAQLGDPPEGHGLLGLIISEGRSIRLPEIAAHPASYGFPPHHPPMHSLLGVPVRVGGRPIGNFYLTDKLDAAEFDDRDEHLVELFAQHAGIAIENARLHAAVGRLAVVEERDRIGRDLHDGIIQSLYGLALSLEDVPELMAEEPGQAAARVDRAIDGLNATIRDLRQFVFGLRPEPVETTHLRGLLAALATQFRQNSVIDLELHIADDADLSPHRRSEVLHIAREALSNVVRHSGATRASLRTRTDGKTLVLTVADNGRGFDPEAPRADNHYGLVNMRDRAMAIGGRLELVSRPEAGTTVTTTVPIEPHEPTEEGAH